MTLLILVLGAYCSSVIIFFKCIYYSYLIAVRQYFAVAIILAKQNHAIQLLQYALIFQCINEVLPNSTRHYETEECD